jgi:hypothetical protein
MLYIALSSMKLRKLSTALSFLQGTDTVDTEKRQYSNLECGPRSLRDFQNLCSALQICQISQIHARRYLSYPSICTDFSRENGRAAHGAACYGEI